MRTSALSFGIAVFSFLAVPAASESAQKPQIRGVAPERLHLYSPSSEGRWKCLGAPHIEISIEQINDDYCDCPDGSDEPGTAACSHFSLNASVVGLQETRMMYCENAGFRPGRIASWKVNDGVCDYDICCDGSDEPEGVCENKCSEYRNKYVAQLEAQRAVAEAGLAEKNRLELEAQRIRAELEAQLAEKQQELAKLVSSRNAEEPGSPGSSGSSVDATVAEVTERVNELLNTVVTAERKLLLSHNSAEDALEPLLKDLAENYNPNFNDPAVKAAVQGYRNFVSNKPAGAEPAGVAQVAEEFQRVKEGLGELQSHILQLAEIAKAAGQPNDGIGAQVKEKIQQAVFWLFPELAPEAPKDLKDLKGAAESSGGSGGAGAETDAERELSGEIARISDQLNRNFGPNDILRALQDACLYGKVGDYSYSLCYTQALHQIDRNTKVKIGTFHSAEIVTEVGEDTSEISGVVPGLNEQQYLLLRYTSGDKCWSGPIRRGSVKVICGEESEMVSVSEPERCEYFFTVKSPLGCFPVEFPEVSMELAHDEL